MGSLVWRLLITYSQLQDCDLRQDVISCHFPYFKMNTLQKLQFPEILIAQPRSHLRPLEFRMCERMIPR